MDWKFKREDYRRPAAQLEHIDMTVRFWEDRVEAAGVLTCRAREAMARIELDVDGAKVPYELGRTVAAGEVFTVAVEHVCRPDDVRLEGIYRDVTPPGCPQQYMSQCQQFGFQRILPVIDDCTAKCTFRTALEGDARYTHLISNGDRVSDGLIDGGARRRVVYENRQPMAPYLFLACAGTWEEVADEVVYPDSGRRIRLEYLVPPGRGEGAREALRVLKESVLFQHELTGYVYPYETYRTICMEKSLYGGMENTGNTTIITEAALIDGTLPDRRLLYAHGVIAHEYEHNHCGSGVTMESVFDMWLNEAYTVNVERAYLARSFGAAFTRRRERAELRAAGGAFAEEESGMAGAVVRAGVNDPDEVVDAITYDKAPEVLGTLRNLLGAEVYDRAWRAYFDRFAGGNANTDDFLNVFSETSGRDVRALIGPYLFRTGFPTVTAGWRWADGRLTVRFTRDAASRAFNVPVTWTAVKDGKDLCGGVFTLDSGETCETVEYSAPFPVEPDFVSWDRGGAFYGVLEPAATDAQLACQARTDPDEGNRIAALRHLRERGASETWLELYAEVFADTALEAGFKAEMLTVDADSLNRFRRARVRENAAERRALRRAAAGRIGETELTVQLELARARAAVTAPAALARRAWIKVILDLLAALDTPGAWNAIRAHLTAAEHITDRLNALTALTATNDPLRAETLEAHGAELRGSLNGYIAYLGVVAGDPHADVFAAMKREQMRDTWSVKHPGLSRALFCGFTANADRLWTAEGLAWLEKTLPAYARVSEYNAVRLLAPLAVWRRFEPGLRAEVKALLGRVAAELPRARYPFIGGKLAALARDEG